MKRAATRKANGSPIWISGPENADPTGWPAQLSPIDTANARPNQAGFVRRWRIENIQTSKGPVERPVINMAAATTQALPAKASMPTATPPTALETPMISRSRPSVLKRPKSSAEGMAARPKAAHKPPTRAGLPWSCVNTITGRATTRMPQPRFITKTTVMIPRNVGLWMRT
ncbi:MAG TPA: hypothetical protein VG104_08730 [Candidatus Dormibacteraeota bacterium]|nr:hypothetical protein [Candidatus Dormibacteraeota bacterium]